MSWDWGEYLFRWGLWESMHPGSFTGHEDVDCPYCGTSLDVEISHRYGTDEYVCCECGGEFSVDWRHGKINYFVD